MIFNIPKTERQKTECLTILRTSELRLFNCVTQWKLTLRDTFAVLCEVSATFVYT